MTTLTEADVEQASLDWLGALGWRVAHGPDVGPDAADALRDAMLPGLVSGEVGVMTQKDITGSLLYGE